MKKMLRAILPQGFVNNFYHLPKAVLANIFYGFPTRKLKVIGITGTDGKTTTTNMIFQILKAAGKKVSMVSTVNAFVAGKSYDTGFHVTSPDPFTVQKFAKEAANYGDEYLILEVTSHALDQFRFWGINCEVGVITNITHEHLDYHKSFESYYSTKLKLIKDAKFAVINQSIEDVRSFDFAQGKGVRGRVVTFGLEKGDFNQKEVKLSLKIPGNYNLENGLAAMATAFSLGIDRKVAEKALSDFEGLVGRMEEVKNRKGIKIFIDFAHTPNGLEQALLALGSQKERGRLIALIGCEGYRDIGKRELMGGIAQRLANIVIVTAVDPRGQIDIINSQIRKGAEKAGAKEGINFFVIEDRTEAINFAVNRLAKTDDTIGLFGKGHETSMNMDGKKELAWSDRKAVEDVLNG